MSTFETIGTILGMAALSAATAFVITTSPSPEAEQRAALNAETKQAIYRAAATRHAAARDARKLNALVETASITACNSNSAPSKSCPTREITVVAELVPSHGQLAAENTAIEPPLPKLAKRPNANAASAPSARPAASAPAQVKLAALEPTSTEKPENVTSVAKSQKKASASPHKKKLAKKSSRTKMSLTTSHKMNYPTFSTAKKQNMYFKGSILSLLTGIVRS